jgi:hypothetical protein
MHLQDGVYFRLDFNKFNIHVRNKVRVCYVVDASVIP